MTRIRGLEAKAARAREAVVALVEQVIGLAEQAAAIRDPDARQQARSALAADYGPRLMQAGAAETSALAAYHEALDVLVMQRPGREPALPPEPQADDFRRADGQLNQLRYKQEVREWREAAAAHGAREAATSRAAALLRGLPGDALVVRLERAERERDFPTVLAVREIALSRVAALPREGASSDRDLLDPPTDLLLQRELGSSTFGLSQLARDDQQLLQAVAAGEQTRLTEEQVDARERLVRGDGKLEPFHASAVIQDQGGLDVYEAIASAQAGE